MAVTQEADLLEILVSPHNPMMLVSDRMARTKDINASGHHPGIRIHHQNELIVVWSDTRQPCDLVKQVKIQWRHPVIKQAFLQE